MKHKLIDIIEDVIIRKMRYSIPRIGKVLKVDDSNNVGRVLCAVPALGIDTAEKAQWCFVSDKRGYVIPAIDDYVIIVWIDGRPELPVIVGFANEMKNMTPKSYDGNRTTNVLFEDTKKKIKIVYDETKDELDIGKGTFAKAARKDDQVKSVTADDSAFWTTLIGGILTWLTTHTHPVPGVVLGGPGTTTSTSVNPAPSNPGSITGKITAGSSQIQIGDKS